MGISDEKVVFSEFHKSKYQHGPKAPKVRVQEEAPMKGWKEIDPTKLVTTLADLDREKCISLKTHVIVRLFPTAAVPMISNACKPEATR